MKIILEEKSKLLALAIGYYQFVENDDFEPAAIGVTSNRIVIYSDFKPDEIQNNSLAYSIKKVISLSDVKTIVVENIMHNKELKKYKRLNIIMKNTEDSTFFYFNKVDSKYMKKAIKALKYAEKRVVKHKVDLASIA